MDFGAHLPLIDFDESGYSLPALTAYAESARDLGYAALAANDHLLFGRPWLDGPTSLAAVLPCSGEMQLMTTVALPVIRGPVATAKTLGAIDALSGGRLVVGVGPGSSRQDYEAVGLDFDERWKRLDDAVKTLRGLWRGESYSGAYYHSAGLSLQPRPAQTEGPPIWIGSWGSEAGLRRTARLADGWLASAYNTNHATFAAAWQRLQALRAETAAPGAAFPNALATMWTFVTEDAAEQRRVIEDVLAKLLNRPSEELASRLTVGPAEACAELLTAYQRAGVQRVLIWPVGDARRQLDVFMTRVVPLVGQGFGATPS